MSDSLSEGGDSLSDFSIPSKRRSDALVGDRSHSTGPPPQILYRFVHKDTDGEVLSKKESPEPIDLLPPDDGPVGLTDETVLEVITTKVTRGKGSGRNNYEHIGTETILKIHSIYLINALRDVVKYFPGLSLRGEPVTIEKPYLPLVHYIDELKAYKNDQSLVHNKEYVKICNDHIDILLSFLDRAFGEILRLERERHQRQPPVATFEYLWLLFKPGQDVYHVSKQGDVQRPMVVAEVSGPHGPLGMTDPDYTVRGWFVRYLDNSVGPVRESVRIDIFDGEKEITSLPVFPRQFHPNNSALEAQFIERGKKYWGLCEPSYKEYSGMTLSLPQYNLNGKVMVDFNSYYVHTEPIDDDRQGHRFRFISAVGPDWEETPADGCQCTLCLSRADKGTSDKRLSILDHRYKIPFKEEAPQGPPSDHFYMLCDHNVAGYALEKRQWVKLHIDNISEPIIENDPFQYLVLDSEIKDTIKSLVWNYSQSDAKVKSWSEDFVKEKGEGRILLLHGSPGVGKTCTAECVADLIRRPLLALTCGDMGIVAEDVEENLKHFFELGELWGAVILMDEADIYLEQRTSDNLERNSLVSVFLRSLEYFRGVLFLTTNRVASFDSAFISRIHVALHYKRLNDDDRRQIWAKNFSRLKKEGVVEVNPETIIFAVSDPEVQAVEWNGREIRNAFLTAVAMAGYEAKEQHKSAVTLEPKHLRSVVKMSRLFKDYISSTQKNQDEASRRQ